MTSSRQFLNDLRSEIEAHPGVNHLFLQRLATSPFSREDYRVFAENHFPLVCAFTSYLELLLLRSPDSEGRLWLSRVLVDEYGEGSEGKDHATLYGGFVRACGGDPERERATVVRAPALQFIRTHQALVRRADFLEGLGAVGPGHEWAIPRMFEAVIPGLRRAGFSEAEIGYFTLHVEQDGDHGRWLEEALARYTSSERAQARVRRGALASLAARARFWDGVQRAVVRYRQPRATRQDGSQPRSVVHELLLSAWDGSALARAAEERVQRALASGRPALDRLVQQCRTIS